VKGGQSRSGKVELLKRKEDHKKDCKKSSIFRMKGKSYLRGRELQKGWTCQGNRKASEGETTSLEDQLRRNFGGGHQIASHELKRGGGNEGEA